MEANAGRRQVRGHLEGPQNPHRAEQQGVHTVLVRAVGESGIEFKLSGAVLESKLAEVPDGSQVLLTFKGKPKNTYSDYSVAVWGDQPAA
jgi:hypothetical protein